jgi:hypothetical protein
MRKTEIRCSAIWGYDAQSSNDLSFAQDDIIINYPLKSGEQPDWGYGQSELTGLKGFFPANYVEPVKDDSGNYDIFKTTGMRPLIINAILFILLNRKTEYQGASTLGL